MVKRVRVVRSAASAAAAMLSLAVLAFPQSASADALRGFCRDVSSMACFHEDGVTAVTMTDTPEFGFGKGGRQYANRGAFYLDVLIPDSVKGAGSESIVVNGVHTDLASVSGDNRGDWTSGSLSAFLDRAARPSDPIGPWLKLTQSFQPAAQGYDVYDFNFGTVNYAQGVPEFSSVFAYPAGSVVTAFFCAPEAAKCVATARKNSLMIENAQQRLIIPEPMTLSLFGAGLMALGVMSRRRKLPQLVSRQSRGSTGLS